MKVISNLNDIARNLRSKEKRVRDYVKKKPQGCETGFSDKPLQNAKSVDLQSSPGPQAKVSNSLQEFWSKYVILPDLLLGKGAFSTVVGVSLTDVTELSTSKRKFACKIIHLVPDDSDPQPGQTTKRQMHQELQVLKTIRHPNLLHLHDYYLDDKKCYLVTDLLEGGDLQEALEHRGSFPEEDAQSIMRGLLSGVAHLHEQGIAHRDIKLENILLVSGCDVTKVKLIDLGMAKHLVSDGLNSVCGTPLFMAPEVLRPSEKRDVCRSRYGLQADVWSCGVVLYMLLSGCPPFQANGLYGLFKEIRAGAFDFDDPAWSLVSPLAKEFVCCLLKQDPKKRITAAEALTHPWLRNIT
uniref:Pkinase-domain-containing protein n=1 Tax=Tetraselmis sp. GSL018 TaxID=582737 RepID=A0A061QZE5_9CHLO|mmetsp:Transcript_33309/g.78996  ORF Transcript_33309/g.78996 Transcript_33309/m.78996 type:complete len:353 (+) Transcript_33309:155-1213(+)|eukprot:CAMPEP_0177610236 /NCGR_PEP_ID=MMETSP0419_2-20121207/19647_1 /TAXON_ID=582737 /ORGANISM="Tetraselmis sp., Strain GSL018" /LENGTH=352 /DNA_ID=CAMNT_0019105479 /DNA_START=96 /DNA_END=1154 /DNA_ORIENTATION=+